MNNQGWISIHRKILDNPIFQDHDLFILFMFILLSVNHEQKEIIFNGEILNIKEGEMIAGRNSLSEKTHIKPSQIYKKLKLLEKLGICNIKSNNKFSLISVVKWNEYQNAKTKSNNKKNNKVTTKEQQSNTNNNDNNDNNIPKGIGVDTPVPVEPKVKKQPDKRVQELIDYLKERVGGQLDGTDRTNRQYCYNLINRLKKAYPEFDTVKQIKILIDKGLQDPFHQQNLTNFKYIFYNYVKMIQQLKQKSNFIYKV